MFEENMLNSIGYSLHTHVVCILTSHLHSSSEANRWTRSPSLLAAVWKWFKTMRWEMLKLHPQARGGEGHMTFLVGVIVVVVLPILAVGCTEMTCTTTITAKKPCLFWPYPIYPPRVGSCQAWLNPFRMAFFSPRRLFSNPNPSHKLKLLDTTYTCFI